MTTSKKNRHQRRAEAAQARRWHEPHILPPGLDRAAAILWTVEKLAQSAETATGATLILPDGSSVYVSAADARSLHSSTGKVAQ